MVADHFGLHTRTPTEAEIDRGAKALRERQMSGKKLNAWETLPTSTKKKWREHAEAVLRAAYRP
jgi:hypothetical protein